MRETDFGKYFSIITRAKNSWYFPNDTYLIRPYLIHFLNDYTLSQYSLMWDIKIYNVT